MKNLPDLAEHTTNLCVGALAIGGAAAGGLSGIAVPLAALAAIGLQLRGSCARRGGEKAARAVLEALVAARDLSEQDAERALDLLREADVSRGLTTGQFAAAARDMGPAGDVNLALGAALAAQMTDPGDSARAALGIAFAAAIGALRRDEDFHRDLTQDMLIALLQGQGLLSRSQEDVQRKLDALSRDYHTLAEALKDHQRLRRDEMEAIASRFEIARVYDLTDAQLREQLELRAADYRRFQGQIEAIDERTKGLGNLKAAARDAAERLDFAEVEALLSRVDQVETEIAAETKVLRADNALLRGRAEEAFAILSAAADSFASIDAREPGRRRLDYEDRLYAHGLRYGGVGIALAARMIRAALEDLSEEDDARLWAGAQNALGAALRAQGARLGGAEGAALLGEAAAACRAALRVRTEAAHPVDWAMTQNNLGNALRAQGSRLGGAEGAALLDKAAAAYRAALRVRTEAAHPVDWAMTTENLGLAWESLAKIEPGEDPRKPLQEAAACFEAALRVYDSETMPYDHGTAAAALARVRAKLAGLPDPA